MLLLKVAEGWEEIINNNNNNIAYFKFSEVKGKQKWKCNTRVICFYQRYEDGWTLRTENIIRRFILLNTGYWLGK